MTEANEESSVIPEEETSQRGFSEVKQSKGQEVTENRLMISKIVCENFKSYAGVKELGPFHKVRS